MAFNIFSRFKEILFKNSNQQAEIETAIDSDTERNVEIISEDLMFSNIYEGREFNDDEIIAFKNQREYKKAVLAANELLHLDSFKELGQQMVEIIEDIRSCEYDKKILNDFFADIYEKMKQENLRLDAEKTVITSYSIHYTKLYEGIDVGAKFEIYQIICNLAKQGIGVIVVSSELPEVMGVCDRIIVMCQGRITGELSRQEATDQKILMLAMKDMLGGNDNENN